MELMERSKCGRNMKHEDLRNKTKKNRAVTHRNLRYTAVTAMLVIAICGCSKGPDKYELREQAIALYEQQDYQGAIEKLNEALTASDGQVSQLQLDILEYRGECEIRTGDYDAAKDTFTALSELLEESTEKERCRELKKELETLDNIRKAAELFNAGKYADAYDAFSEYAVLDGTITGQAATFNKAVCAEYIGEFEEAYKILTEYLAHFPEDEAARREANFCKSRM